MNRPALVEALMLLDKLRNSEARSWGVVVIDLDVPPGKVTSFYGPLDTPEQALALAADLDRNPHTGAHPEDGEPGWRHVVVPMYDPEAS